MTSAVVLLAAGSGSRFGSRTPKQFLPLKKRPLFAHSLDVFLNTPSVKRIVVVAHPKHHSFIRKHARRIPAGKTLLFAEGGRFRGESVKNGVRALLSEKPLDVILVHDSARVLITKEIVERVGKAAKSVGVSLAAWPLGDTLKLSSASRSVRKTIPRKDLWLAQTPQGFRWDVAKACLLNPNESATDDVALAEAKGFRVRLVEGSPTNIKVTYPSDLKLCEVFLK